MKQRQFPMAHHRRSGRFLEACLLCLLNKEKSYGYNLLERLQEFGFDNESINISVIYRNLQGMEEENLIISEWSESEIGPKKRIYSITKRGEVALSDWINFLKERKNHIEMIINSYQEG